MKAFFFVGHSDRRPTRACGEPRRGGLSLAEEEIPSELAFNGENLHKIQRSSAIPLCIGPNKDSRSTASRAERGARLVEDLLADLGEVRLEREDLVADADGVQVALDAQVTGREAEPE